MSMTDLDLSLPVFRLTFTDLLKPRSALHSDNGERGGVIGPLPGCGSYRRKEPSFIDGWLCVTQPQKSMHSTVAEPGYSAEVCIDSLSLFALQDVVGTGCHIKFWAEPVN